MLTAKQEIFVQEYLLDFNATQAALRAGYSEKTAKSQASVILNKADVKAAIEARLTKIDAQNIAKSKEVLQYITTVMRGECEEQDPATKPPTVHDRLKAAEMLGKYHAIFTEKQKVAVTLPVVVTEDLEN